MIVEIKGKRGMSVKFTNTGKDEFLLQVARDGNLMCGIVLPLAEMLKGLAEINYHENSGDEQG